MKRNFALVRFTFALGLVFSLCGTAFAEVPRIILDQGTVEPMPIALPVFGGSNPADNQLGAEMARVILRRS